MKGKDKERKRERDKEDNINNKFKHIQNIFKNRTNEFEEIMNKKKHKYENLNTNEGFYKSQIIQLSNTKKIINNEENDDNSRKKNILKNEDNSCKDDDIIDLEYKNIMELTEEGKDEDICKIPNVSGFIHSKKQIEKNNSRKIKGDNGCNFI